MNFHLMIVDDEAPIRKGISRFINWDAIDCTIEDTASDGLEAMEKLKQYPIDIVITDIRMPEADGLMLARHINENYPDVKVIILTGYADFLYAQTAIQYNVSDFLLKPISKEKVITAVQNAQKKIIASRQSHQAKQADFAFLKDQLFQELTDHPQDKGLLERLNEYGIHLNHYCIAAFQLLPPGGSIPALKELVTGHIEDGVCYRYNNLLLSVSPLPADLQTPAGALPRYREIVEMARSMYAFELSVGISAAHDGVAEYETAVYEAINALTQNFYSQSCIACHDEKLPSGSSYQMSAEEALSLNELESAIINRDFAAAKSVVSSIFIRMKSRFAKSVDAKNICMMIYYVGFRALVKKGKHVAPEDLTDRISHSSDIFELEEIIREYLEYLHRELTDGEALSRIVCQALAYIDSHLSETLSLDTIAGAIPVTPSYLSRTFKKETGQGLTDYINMARIEKAKELLSDGRVLNYEVAEQAGFHDPAYFSATFKKYTGMSPKEYKNQMGRG